MHTHILVSYIMSTIYLMVEGIDHPMTKSHQLIRIHRIVVDQVQSSSFTKKKLIIKQS